MLDRKKTVLDEREMLEMYRIEHFGLWMMYALLCGAVLLQALTGASLVQMAGELVAIVAVSVTMIIANVRHGIWDERSRPSARGNAAYSLGSGMLVAAVLAAVGKGAMAAVLAGCVSGALCMLLLTVLMHYMKRRQEKTDEELENE